MVNLTFGEQVKIILSRKGMTIKELAELIEERTGKKMSRQNLTQRLGRDNFQEQDMREIAEILECPFKLSILEDSEVFEKPVAVKPKKAEKPKAAAESVVQKPAVESVTEDAIPVREITIGDLVDVPERKPEPVPVAAVKPKVEEAPKPEVKNVFKGFKKPSNTNTSSSQESTSKVYLREPKKPEILGEINPYTRKEYATNSVRMHPKRIGYVQVYDQAEHKWTDMTEWAFLGYQERKKRLLGKDYVPPTYLD